MGQQRLPEAPKVKNTQYELLYGVDYSRDVTDVDRRHSPDMVNMISDLGGNPIKRDGYRAISRRFDGMVFCHDRMIGVRRSDSLNYLNIYALEMVDGELRTTSLVNTQKNCGQINKVLSFRNSLIVICTNYIAYYDIVTGEIFMLGTEQGTMSVGAVGSTAPAVDKDEVIPTVTIGLQPDGYGGSAYYDKNIFSIYQRVSFLSTTYSDEDGAPIGTTDYVIPAYQKIGSWVKVEVRNASTGEYEEVHNYTLSEPEVVQSLNLNGVGTVQSVVVEPKIMFDELPPEPVIAGQDNIRITYAPFSMEKVDDDTVKGYYNKSFVSLLNSITATIYNSRLMVADDCRTYYSNAIDILMMPDNAWFEVDNSVMCYTRTSSYLAVITKDTGTNTIYLASEQSQVVNAELGETETYFSIKPSNAGVGAVSPKCFGVLNDEPVFLSSTGLYGILSNYVSEKYAINRTGRINRRMCKEENLENAVGVSFNSYFYIAINSRMYVIDSRHRDNSKNGDTSYECYFFEGIPVIRDMYIIDNKMFFADETNLYTWNSDLPETARYYDNAHIDNGGEWTGTPVKAKWCSALDDDGAPHLVKTLQKKGSMVTLSPHFKTGAELTLCKDGDTYQYVGEHDATIWSFERVPFEAFTFVSSGQVVDAFMKKKFKKYRRLQIILENNKPEPFGITNVVKAFTVGDLAKPRPAFIKRSK